MDDSKGEERKNFMKRKFPLISTFVTYFLNVFLITSY